jgi:hypothetical protein
MRGDWTVQTEDGAHAVNADIDSGLLGAKLSIAWDGERLLSSQLFVLLGDIGSFQHQGHSFQLNIHGFGLMGALVLLMDGAEIPPRGAAAAVERHAAPAQIQFVREVGVLESEEVVGTEDYPLDNRFGDETFTSVHQVSRESTNELSIDTTTQVTGTAGLTLFSAIKAEIEAQVSQQTGLKIGETVTESQTLTFSVGPKSSVIYQVVWKRRVRSGERLYLSGGNQMTVPYRISYGLTYEVRTQEQTHNT